MLMLKMSSKYRLQKCLKRNKLNCNIRRQTTYQKSGSPDDLQNSFKSKRFQIKYELHEQM